MSVYLESQFVPQLSYRLSNFTRKGPHLWNFRCPFCKDSEKSSRKSRGYIFRKKDSLYFYCHNCGKSLTFSSFLRELDPNLSRQFSMERFRSESKITEKISIPVIPNFVSKSINLPSIESLPENDFAKKYCKDRKIPEKYFNKIYFTDDFSKFVKEMEGSSDEKKLVPNELRIVFPFYDRNKNLIGFQGRALQKSPVKYITIRLNENSPKLYGLDTVDLDRPIKVVEGPINSLFLENSIAVMHSALYRIVPILGSDKEYIFLYDNDPRNPQIVQNMEKTIESGWKIFIWPDKWKKFEDINDLILAGITSNEIEETIKRYSFSDLRSRMEFYNWKKR